MGDARNRTMPRNGRCSHAATFQQKAHAEKSPRESWRQGAASGLLFGLGRALGDRFIEKLLHLARSLLGQFALLAA